MTALTRETLVRAGLMTSCRERLQDGLLCHQPAEFVLWGKLFPPEALGPRCYDHARERTDIDYVHMSAVCDLRPLHRLLEEQETGV